MTHPQLRRIAITATVAGLALAVSGCSYNPLNPAPGGVRLRVHADCSVDYQNEGRDAKNMTGELTCPNGSHGKFHVGETTGSTASVNATNQQAAINMALVMALPKLSAADIMKLLPLLVGAPPVPLP